MVKKKHEWLVLFFRCNKKDKKNELLAECRRGRDEEEQQGEEVKKCKKREREREIHLISLLLYLYYISLN